MKATSAARLLPLRSSTLSKLLGCSIWQVRTESSSIRPARVSPARLRRPTRPGSPLLGNGCEHHRGGSSLFSNPTYANPRCELPSFVGTQTGVTSEWTLRSCEKCALDTCLLVSRRGVIDAHDDSVAQHSERSDPKRSDRRNAAGRVASSSKRLRAGNVMHPVRAAGRPEQRSESSKL